MRRSTTIEHDAPGANITTAGDAIWWGLVTITTVGYGDQYPVTQSGRVIGTFLLFAGIALFSVLTGFIANAFLAPPAKPRLQSRTEPRPRSRPSGRCSPSRMSVPRPSARTGRARKTHRGSSPAHRGGSVNGGRAR